MILPDKTVYVLDAATGTLAARAVKTGIANWEFTEILAASAAGDRVVSSIDRDGRARRRGSLRPE